MLQPHAKARPALLVAVLLLTSFLQGRASCVAAAGQSAASTAQETANPVDEAQFFVRQHYLDFLGRVPDDSGLAF
ncbi:MAG: hypothetical protein M3444_17990 [Acidobacteriota bacterium]|nr:hypothetical protein [Acidobacteriota bacterium]